MNTKAIPAKATRRELRARPVLAPGERLAKEVRIQLSLPTPLLAQASALLNLFAIPDRT
jgi:hypothetical protein